MTHTRPIYEKAIDVMPEKKAREMCIRYAELEQKLGEIDRARAIYAHCSQMCDPRVHGEFWTAWKEFEIRHGNEDTVREMLRIKRSVQAIFNTQVNVMSAQMLAATGAGASAGGGGGATGTGQSAAADSMAMLEAQAQELVQSAKSKAAPGGNISFVR